MRNLRPEPHSVAEVDEARGYVSSVVTELSLAGIRIERSWLDPMGPVDATIIADSFALVWDEWHGWTQGCFVSGAQGERTVLDNGVRLGGGVLPAPQALARAVTHRLLLTSGSPRPAQARDGLHDALRTYAS